MMKAHSYPHRGDSSDSSVTVHTDNCHLKNARKIKGFGTLMTEVTVLPFSLGWVKSISVEKEKNK